MLVNKILLAGATGYLGRFLTKELVERGYQTRVVVRDKKRVDTRALNLEIVEAQVTKPETLDGICNDTDVVISSLGITRQKDGLTYMEVDYQANINLLDEAIKAGVKKFIYVSVLNGDKLRHLKICEAKERFVDRLKSSGLDYCIVRPNGFFSDMGDFLKMAKGGTIYLFGNGELKLNPIHGYDLARKIVDSLEQKGQEINIGGPDILSQNEIAKLALKAYGKPTRIVHLPDWIRKLTLWFVRKFTSSKTYGPIEFFMTTMIMDMQAPKYGIHKLGDYFNSKIQEDKIEN